ncbi:hypothetical protein [Chroococcus sp. FPU101]|uniref:hypothetical protein n=1 Tax=Chroococcus sp. FPU101 TaxID=1974212 RepID=UPI001A8FB06E|nr:hypothetical protein [Chroococcus sp. FPU101]
MLSNLAQICQKSEITNRIIIKVNAEIRQKREQTKHACKNCVFFNQNAYLMCAVRPDVPTQSYTNINDCLDWELT